MILTCPDCGTQYVVKDDAIPPEGRQVRCAACKHSWHQDPEISAPADAEPAPLDTSEPEHEFAAAEEAEAHEPADEDENLAEATLIDPRSGPEAELRAYEEAVIEGEADVPAVEEASAIPAEAAAGAPEPAEAEPTADWNEPPAAEPATDPFSPFAAEDEVQPRRRSPVVTVIMIVLLIILVAAAFWELAPAGIKAKLGLAAVGSTPLQIKKTHMDRQQLASGNDLLTLTGRVINPSAKEQVVPPIQAELKTHTGKVVYSWVIPPPAPSLAAGASASFNSTEVSVPREAEELTMTLGTDPGRTS